MATKYLFRTAALAALLLAAAACIYPYEVDLRHEGELPLVIEGDIHVGSVTNVQLSYVQPFVKETGDIYTPPIATGYIEGEDGTRIYADDADFPSSALTFHTEELTAGQRYRLHLETYDQQNGGTSNIFESDWLSPAPAPTIDALTYSHHPDYEELWIGLSMHCHGSHYFRWTFSETWEYHSDISTWFEYKPKYRRVDTYAEANLYYCWASAESPQINIFSTANQTEDRFEDLAFHTIPLNDRRLQVMYRINVRLEGMTEDAYNYWHNIQQNSEGQGSIFAPTPSEMASNIHCISNPNVQVIGYLNAAVQAEATLYYDNSLEKYYKPERPYDRFDEKVSVNRPDSMDYWYAHGYLPYQELYETPSPYASHYMWAQKICIDCRVLGGTKDVPEDWPSGHR